MKHSNLLLPKIWRNERENKTKNMTKYTKKGNKTKLTEKLNQILKEWSKILSLLLLSIIVKESNKI